MSKLLSDNFSFEGWSLLEFLKGRKHLAVTFVGGLLGLFLFDSATVAIASAGLVEAGFAIGEYYCKKYLKKI